MSGERPSVVLEALGSPRSGGGVRVEFEWLNDRYFHSISAFGEDSTRQVLRSLEGESDEILPPSPCLTELHQQGDTLFLRGATSACHWSMSVHIGKARFPEQQDLEMLNRFKQRYELNTSAVPTGEHAIFQFLSFDVACRVKRHDCTFGSHYHLFNAMERLAHGNHPYVIIDDHLFNRPLILYLGANPHKNSLQFQPEPNCHVSPVEVTETLLRVGSTRESYEKAPVTLQWRYGVWVF